LFTEQCHYGTERNSKALTSARENHPLTHFLIHAGLPSEGALLPLCWLSEDSTTCIQITPKV